MVLRLSMVVVTLVDIVHKRLDKLYANIFCFNIKNEDRTRKTKADMLGDWREVEDGGSGVRSRTKKKTKN